MNLQNKLQFLFLFMCIGTLGWSQIGITTLGTGAGQNSTNNYTTYIGYNAGVNSDGFGSTFLGAFTGTTNTGSSNTFIGGNAGRFNVSGRSNVFLGFQSGDNNTTGSYNVFSGNDAGGRIVPEDIMSLADILQDMEIRKVSVIFISAQRQDETPKPALIMYS